MNELAPFSIYAKTIEILDREPFILLVQTLRDGDNQMVEAAWRAYPAAVDLSGVTKPTEMLSRFLDVYGWPVRFGNNPETKLLLHQRLEAVSDVSTLWDTRSAPKGTNFLFTFMARRSSDGLDVGFGYATNISKYVSDLRTHGVSVDFDWEKLSSSSNKAVISGVEAGTFRLI